MKKQKVWLLTILVFALLGLIFTACSESTSSSTSTTPTTAEKSGDSDKEASNDEKPVTEKQEPVTVTIGAGPIAITEEEFQHYIIDPVKESYPYITVERIDIRATGQTVNELVATNQIPDIVADYPLTLTNLTRLGIDYNMEELIKSHQFDLSRLPQEYVESLKIASDLDHLIGLPMYNNNFALFYNRELFDRFGIEYPQDDMTWEEVRALAVRLTREEDGVSYRGLFADNVFRGAYQLALPFIDGEKDQAVFQTEGWRGLFDLWYRLYYIGEVQPNFTSESFSFQQFTNGELAMFTGYTGNLQNLLTVEDFDWDLVTYPINPLAPGVGQRVDPIVLSITEQSKNKDASFRVLEVILSDEVQMEMSRNLRISVLKNEEIHQAFGNATPEFAEKNVVAFTKLKLAILQPFKFELNPNPAVIANQAFNKVLEGTDINTALREADEQMNALIQEAKKK